MSNHVKSRSIDLGDEVADTFGRRKAKRNSKITDFDWSRPEHVGGRVTTTSSSDIGEGQF
jgi:hypothetical protein